MALQKRLFVFSHFDVNDLIDDYVIFYLKSIKKCNADIVFVTTSKLDTVEKKKIENIVDQIICRDNIGYDFMSYRAGLLESKFNMAHYEQVIICNDSVYGPFYDLNTVFHEMQQTNYDFWGISVNREKGKHIQSYFIVFNKRVIASEAIRDFFRQVRVLKNKDDIITQYELGLTKYLKKRGYRFGSFCRYPSLLVRGKCFLREVRNTDRRRNTNDNLVFSFIKLLYRVLKGVMRLFIQYVISRRRNVTIVFWKEILQKNCPFLKIMVIRNSQGKADLEDVVKSVRSLYEYPDTMITSHFNRTKALYGL